MKNVVVKVTSKEHGAEVIQAFKDLGVDGAAIQGDWAGWYYGLFEGKFNFMPKPHNSQVITLEELKSMANPYPKMMWVWNRTEQSALKKTVLKEVEYNGHIYYMVEGPNIPSICRHAKDIEEPIEITLEQIAEKFGVNVEQIKIKK